RCCRPTARQTTASAGADGASAGTASRSAAASRSRTRAGHGTPAGWTFVARSQKPGSGSIGSFATSSAPSSTAAVHDAAAAAAFGIAAGEVLLTLHCGSRAIGHQVATDYQRDLAKAARRLGLSLPDRELVCAPIDSPEGRRYHGAMAAAVNAALANRQVIAALAARAFREVLPEARVRILYDVSHNTCKVEEHEVDGERRPLWVHRKGATRAFGPGHPDLPAAYRDAGQPVLVGGTMGTGSYVLAGTAASAGLAFASACHGAGRSMSRNEALRHWRGDRLQRELAARGILIKGHSLRGLAEEAPGAYKDIDSVADATHEAGLARKVARLRPIACVKG
ncbi:MAG TPA: RtcB family protein, partial [Planctomycetota bacterium]|nr:RtcB family protein [Planctomycetota bacterium]